MAQTNPFDQFDNMAQPVPVRQLEPIIGATTPEEQQREQRAEERDETRLGLTIEGDARNRDNETFDRIGTLRKEFNAEPLVREFRGVEGATRQIVDLASRETDTPGPGDIALIISYMKALDPGSVVREGEFATAENAGGVPERIRNFYNKVVEGGRISPEIRSEFARTAVGIYNSRRNQYDSFANTYRGLIEGEGANPDRQGIRLSEELQFGEDGFAPSARQAPPLADPEMVGGVPRGTEVELGFDQMGRDGVSRGQSYLESIGIFPNDEARITAFWNANRASPDLTVENVKQWYAQNNYPAPTDEDIAATIEEAKQGAEFSGIDTSSMDEEYEGQLRMLAEQRGSDPESMAETAAVAGATGLTLGFNDEIAGAMAVPGAIMRGEDAIGAYEAERDVVRQFREDAAEKNPTTSLISELIGGTFTGGRAVGSAAARQGARGAAAEGARVGAVTGFGYGEGVEGSVGGAALGAPIGAGAGVAGDMIARRAAKLAEKFAARRGGSAASEGREVIEAADRFNAATGARLEPLPADVGGANTRRAAGGAAQTTFGAKPIVEGSQRLADEGQAGVQTIARRQGSVPGSKQAGGEAAMRGADKAMKREKTRVDVKYANARKEADGARVPLPFAQTVAAREIAELSDTPGGVDAAAQLRDVVGDLNGDWSIDGIKRFRKLVRDKLVKDGLRGSEVEAAANRIIDAADVDIEDGLVMLGKEGAARAYAEASQAAAERFTLIDDILAPILGSKGERSGEQVYAAIERMSRGDSVALGKFMRALPDDEAGAIRALMIDRLGRATKGRQDADGQAFSLNDFLTRWNDEGLSKEAKGVLFDAETRAALDDLARVAQGTKESQRFANFSNTGGASWFNVLINGGPAGAVFYDPVTAGGAAVAAVTGQILSGKLLASPKFARWLAKMPKQGSPSEVRAHIRRLDRIAAADTAIAAETLGLQKAMLEAFERGPVSASAEPQGSTED